MASIELLTVAEVSKLLKCNVDFVYKLNKAGLLRFMKLGNLKSQGVFGRVPQQV